MQISSLVKRTKIQDIGKPLTYHLSGKYRSMAEFEAILSYVSVDVLSL